MKMSGAPSAPGILALSESQAMSSTYHDPGPAGPRIVSTSFAFISCALLALIYSFHTSSAVRPTAHGWRSSWSMSSTARAVTPSRMSRPSIHMPFGLGARAEGMTEKFDALSQANAKSGTARQTSSAISTIMLANPMAAAYLPGSPP